MIQVIGVLLLVGTTAGDPPRDSVADDLVTRGLELRRAGRADEALEILQRACALAPSPRTVGQVGLAEASSSHWLDAERHLDSALGVPADPWVRKNKPFLEQAMELSHQHVGQLVVTGPPGVTVFVAGNLIGRLPIAAPVRVAEGNLLVSATAPGFAQVIRAVDVPGGGRVEVSLVMEPLSLGPSELGPTVQLVDAEDPKWRRWTGGALLAAGAGALIFGSILIAIDQDTCCGGRTLETWRTGWVVVGVGSALAVTGVVVLWSAHGRGADAAVAVVPTGLRLAGSF